MMKETDLQSMLVDAVEYARGRGHKMSNRFLIGVSDVIVKLPKWPAGFIEVKQRAYPTSDKPFELDVTTPQANFLRDFDAAGMPCGVASFLQSGVGTGKKIWLSVMTYRTLAYTDDTVAPFTISRSAHHDLGRSDERLKNIVTILHHWQQSWKDERTDPTGSKRLNRYLSSTKRDPWQVRG